MAVPGILPDFIPTANIPVPVPGEFCPLKSRLQERVKTWACLRSPIHELEGMEEPLSGERGSQVCAAPEEARETAAAAHTWAPSPG